MLKPFLQAFFYHLSSPIQHRVRHAVCFLIVLLSFCTGSAHAWNATGHRQVVAVAWAHLTPAQQQQVEQLLRSQPLIPETALANSENAWMNAALWPDNLRDRAESSDTAALPHTQRQWLKQAQSGEGTRRWHFADRNIALPFSAQKAHGLLEEALNAQIRLLAEPTLDKAERAIALAWVSHLVADAHQPLHCASRNDPTRPGQLDAGGNTVTIFDAGRRPPEAVSLHRWWDELPGHARPGTPRFSSETARLLRQAQKINAPDVTTPPLQWIETSFNIARDQVYPGLVSDPEFPAAFLIRQDYWIEGREITRERLALAGRRLANIVAQALSDLH